MSLPGSLGHLSTAARLRVRFAWEQHIEPALLGHRIEHVAGPKRIAYGTDEVLAICVVRNGALHIRSFVEHHLRLGVHHIVFLDNGSTDGTVALASELENVTVLRTGAPYRRYENTMKRYLARRFSSGRWNLCVDIDERFDYPGSDRVGIGDLVRYLRERRYTAMIAQMLDLFPDCALEALETYDEGPIERTHAYYDLSKIRRAPYRWGKLENGGIRMHWGGIRNALFGSDGALTKAALVLVRPTMDLFSGWHHSRRARIADVTGVLLHYPFAGSFHTRVQDAVLTGRYGETTTDEYRKYLGGLQSNRTTSLRLPTAQRLNDLQQLIDDEFIVVSPAYQSWLDRRTGGGEKGKTDNG
jgi:hypothetical protein